jgi:transposase
MDGKAEKLALFRYGLIAPLVLEPLPRGELTRRAQEIASRHYDIPFSKRTTVSVDTLFDWAVRYRHGGFEALAPKPRQDRGQSRAITPQLATLIERLKRENPHRTGTTLLRELALSAGQDVPTLSAATLYRFLKQRGLSERQLLAPAAHKKFEAELSNQIWQADMLFGPWVQRPGGGRMQVFLHATLDDATLLLVGQPLLRRTLSLQMHEPLRQRIAVQYHLEGLSREELDAYLAHQLKAAGVTQPLFDEMARQALYQATKGIPRKVNKLALTALRLAASRKESTVGESVLLDATTEALL